MSRMVNYCLLACLCIRQRDPGSEECRPGGGGGNYLGMDEYWSDQPFNSHFSREDIIYIPPPHSTKRTINQSHYFASV
jgi:hypothetical protein